MEELGMWLSILTTISILLLVIVSIGLYCIGYKLNKIYSNIEDIKYKKKENNNENEEEKN